MGGQVLGYREGVDAGGEGLEAFLVVFDDFDRLHEGVHAEACGEAGGAAGGQHVVGAGHVVAQRHRGVRTAEDGTGVLDALDDRIGILGLNLKVFGGVGVGRVDGLVETVGQHDGRLGAGQRRVDTLGVLGTRHGT